MPQGRFSINYYPEISPLSGVPEDISRGLRIGTDIRRTKYQKQYQDELLKQNQQKLDQQARQDQRANDLARINQGLRLFDSVRTAGGDDNALNNILQTRVAPYLGGGLDQFDFTGSAKEAGSYISKSFKEFAKHKDPRLLRDTLAQGLGRYPRQREAFSQAALQAGNLIEQQDVQTQRQAGADLYRTSQGAPEGPLETPLQEATARAIGAGVDVEDVIPKKTGGAPKTFEAGVMAQEFGAVGTEGKSPEQALADASKIIAAHKKAIAQPGWDEELFLKRQDIIMANIATETFDRMAQELILTGIDPDNVEVIVKAAEEGPPRSWYLKLFGFGVEKSQLIGANPLKDATFLREENGKKVYRLPDGSEIREK
jgi:hypothetical protein